MNDEAPRQVPEATRIALTWVAEMCRRGFTGQLTLEIREGGIRYVKRGDGMEPSALKDELDNFRKEGG